MAQIYKMKSNQKKGIKILKTTRTHITNERYETKTKQKHVHTLHSLQISIMIIFYRWNKTYKIWRKVGKKQEIMHV